MKIYRYGLFVGHMAPIHNGHIHVIQNMIDECECSHIMLLERDLPIPSFECKSLLDRVIRPIIFQDYIHVVPIPYLFNEERGIYTYYNMCRIIKNDGFSLYFSGNKEEVIEQFPSLLASRIIFRHIPEYNGITSQKVRDSLANYDYDYISENCPSVVFNAKYKLTEIIKKVV